MLTHPKPLRDEYIITVKSFPSEFPTWAPTAQEEQSRRTLKAQPPPHHTLKNLKINPSRPKNSRASTMHQRHRLMPRFCSLTYWEKSALA